MSMYGMVIPKPAAEPWSQCNTCTRRVLDAAARICPRKYCDARTVILKCDKVETRKRQDEERKASPSYVDPYRVPPTYSYSISIGGSSSLGTVRGGSGGQTQGDAGGGGGYVYPISHDENGA